MTRRLLQEVGRDHASPGEGGEEGRGDPQAQRTVLAVYADHAGVDT